MMKILVEEIKTLKEDLEISNHKVSQLQTENARLKKSTNLLMFKVDALEQYGRRENWRLNGIPENKQKAGDGEEVIIKVAKMLNVDLKSNDLQRAHRLGKKQANNPDKPRPIIVRFVSYKKRNEILFAKSKLKTNADYKHAFITEDLTPLRSKILQYVKKQCNNNFVLCHTYNGKIRMKKSAKKEGLIGEDEKDEGSGPWLSISSPEDFFKLDIDIDFKKLILKSLINLIVILLMKSVVAMSTDMLVDFLLALICYI